MYHTLNDLMQIPEKANRYRYPKKIRCPDFGGWISFLGEATDAGAN
jgi:hypothetical protein